MSRRRRHEALFFAAVVGVGLALDTFLLPVVEREPVTAGVLLCYLFGVLVGFSVLRGDDDSPAVARSALFAAILVTLFLLVR